MIISSRRPHVVAKIVEPELVVRSVGNVTSVRFLTIRGRHVPLNRAHREPQTHVKRAHPLHISASQIVVHRHNVNALTFNRIQVGWKGRHERLSFPGDHFSNRTAVQHHATDQLHIVMPHVQEAFPRFPTDGKGLDKNIVKSFA